MNKHSDIDVNVCLCVTLGANEDVGGCWGGVEVAVAGGIMMQCSGSSVMKQHEGRDYSN